MRWQVGGGGFEGVRNVVKRIEVVTSSAADAWLSKVFCDASEISV
jgi:hypothetical protein